MSSRAFNIATFNTQGLHTENLNKVSIPRDAEKYNIQVMNLTETHIKESAIEQARGNKKNYTVYHNGIEGTNKYTGVGILIEEEIPATFTTVNDHCVKSVQIRSFFWYVFSCIRNEYGACIRTEYGGLRSKQQLKKRCTYLVLFQHLDTVHAVDRIYYAEIQLDKYNNISNVAYSSAVIISEQNPAVTEDFYDSLSEVTKRINKSRHMMTTIGDFKAKTGTGKKEFLQNISKYGKSRLSTNSRCLLIILSVIEPLGLPLIE